jgi:hypothetical protein
MEDEKRQVNRSKRETIQIGVWNTLAMLKPGRLQEIAKQTVAMQVIIYRNVKKKATNICSCNLEKQNTGHRMYC